MLRDRSEKKICKEDYEFLVKKALNEDIGDGDITTLGTVTDDKMGIATLISKSHGILCGLDLFKAVFKSVDQELDVRFLMKDGDLMHWGEHIAEVHGKLSSILPAERVAINFMQRMSGIATKSYKVSKLVQGTDTIILDTRKTIPGYRKLDKYAVATGGCYNHRMGLYDMALIKDNHIMVAGSITKAVSNLRSKYPDKPIEVEANTLEQVKEAIDSHVDIIMLDNMNNNTIKRAVDMINRQTKIEVSGNIEEDRVTELIDMGIDYISMGKLTHSVKAYDFSLLIKEVNH